jgi:7,8-dihydropterin-6-yl-methyl-4-(beta-D-ribofuranosyl)aminobenzene 5'-phosphate synthase
MKTCVTILCENSVGAIGVIGEHGFCSFIERADEKFLFDTGLGMSLPHNVEALKMDLQGVSKIMISHGHRDHTGSLKWAVEQLPGVEIVSHPEIFSEHMASDPAKPDEQPRFVGCPLDQERLEQLGARFRFVSETTEIRPGLWFVTGVERKPDQQPHDPRLLTPEGGHLRSDPMSDDASLLLERQGAPVLLLGCAHAGVLNILDHLEQKMGISKLYAVLGGTHLKFFSPDFIPRVIDRLEDFSVELVGVSHCTGWKAQVELAKHFGDRFVPASVGSGFVF